MNRMLVWTEGDVVPQFGELASGATAFTAEAWDEDCEACFTGCTIVEVGEDERVHIVLEPTPCDTGFCSTVRGDAGADASADTSDAQPADVAFDTLDGGADVPLDVPDAGGLVFAQIAAGWNYTCAIRSDGDLYCWGQLAFVAPAALQPMLIPVSSSASQVSIGESHACGRFEGEVWCWGRNREQQLGRPSSGNSPPMILDELPGGRSVDVAAGRRHSCAVFDDDNVYCWGANGAGQADPDDPDRMEPILPQVIPDLHGSDVAAGRARSCLIGEAGSLRCWGGRGVEPVVFGGDPREGVTSVEIGGDAGGPAPHICALQGGDLYCWGVNGEGQLGFGDFVDSPRAVPTLAVPGLGEVVDFDLGTRHTCAINTANQLYCWGWNNAGQLGDGLMANRTIPFQVPGAWTQVAAGAGHTCAVNTADEIWCWGRGTEGQLGYPPPDPEKKEDEYPISSLVPVRVEFPVSP